MSNYIAMANRIRCCVSREGFDRVEKSIVRLYDAGIFTVSELKRLDALMVDCMIERKIIS